MASQGLGHSVVGVNIFYNLTLAYPFLLLFLTCNCSLVTQGPLASQHFSGCSLCPMHSSPKLSPTSQQASLQPLHPGGALTLCQALHLLLGLLAVPSAVQLTWHPGGCSGPPHCPPGTPLGPVLCPGREGPSQSGAGPVPRSRGQLSGA